MNYSQLDDYEVREVIGKGMTGTVKLIIKEELEYAAKIIWMDSQDHVELRNQNLLDKEYSIINRLDHPNIIKVFE